jgi:hypothetical protein
MTAKHEATVMQSPITYHDAFDQGSEQWLQARCGLLTASEMKLIITPTLKLASNEKERQHLYELAAQRITGHVEPHYISDDMLRGREDEIYARELYSQHFAPVIECGFVTNSRHGVTIGYSPDGLVGEHGLIEVKSRRQKYQAETLIRHVPAGTIPDDFVLQCQTGLLVTERQWLDFISYCGGMPMCVIRAYPDDVVQSAIIAAAQAFEARMAERLAEYQDVLNSEARLIPTERRIEQEMMIL